MKLEEFKKNYIQKYNNVLYFWKRIDIMNNTNEIIKIILNFLIVGIIIYVVARLFIFLLPVIIVLIILYYVYRIYLETKSKVGEQQSSDKKIVDAEIIDEKFDK